MTLLIEANEYTDIDQRVEIVDEDGDAFSVGFIATDAVVKVGNLMGFASDAEEFGDAEAHKVLAVDGNFITLDGLA